MVRDVVANLDAVDLDRFYRNWTIRQIVHHLADSHVNCYVRFKWTLTESVPAIKAYDESRWSETPEATTAAIESSLVLLDGIHQRWGQLARRMDEQQWERGFFHPESGCIVTLKQALPSYVWHADHHTAQIRWVLEHNR